MQAFRVIGRAHLDRGGVNLPFREEGPGQQEVAFFLRHRQRFARQQGFIDLAFAIEYDGIAEHLIPKGDDKHVA